MTKTSETRPDRKRAVFWTVIAIAVVSIGVLGLLIGTGRREPERSTTAGDLVLFQVTAEAVPGVGFQLSLANGEATVYVPGSALTQEGSLALLPREPDLFPEAGIEPGWSRPRVISLEFYTGAGALVPHPQLANLVDVCFRVGPDDWTGYLRDQGAYVVEFYDEEGSPRQWMRLPTYGRVDQIQICGQARHLTLFALAARREPEATEIPSGPYAP